MAKHYYKSSGNSKRLVRIGSLLLSLIGILIFIYVIFPLISWQIYFAPGIAEQSVRIPIPRTVYAGGNVGSLLSFAGTSLTTDFTNAENWYPATRFEKLNNLNYLISIPKIGVADARVSSADTDLTQHMVQYNTDTGPSRNGNTVIFGHSTLPQLYNPNDYKTILANAYKVEVGDEIIVTMDKEKYKYKVQSIIVVEPEDTSVLAQDLSDSYITIITCTPPGTIWKRLVIKAKLT